MQDLKHGTEEPLSHCSSYRPHALRAVTHFHARPFAVPSRRPRIQAYPSLFSPTTTASLTLRSAVKTMDLLISILPPAGASRHGCKGSTPPSNPFDNHAMGPPPASRNPVIPSIRLLRDTSLSPAASSTSRAAVEATDPSSSTQSAPIRLRASTGILADSGTLPYSTSPLNPLSPFPLPRCTQPCHPIRPRSSWRITNARAIPATPSSFAIATHAVVHVARCSALPLSCNTLRSWISAIPLRRSRLDICLTAAGAARKHLCVCRLAQSRAWVNHVAASPRSAPSTSLPPFVHVQTTRANAVPTLYLENGTSICRLEAKS
ncbi:hypothetical protein K438DRAFT_1972609 [Mycena galopus ATCC 62051]|nr:hypothetical protein K438DRAFT_1972609 [Mycena galopus ATCC 62051]